MERKDFFTQDFYERPALTMGILNKLIDPDYVADSELHHSGRDILLSIYQNENTINIFSQIIADLDAYKQYRNARYFETEVDSIEIDAILEEHENVFKGTGKTIMWDARIREFVFDEDYDYLGNHNV